MYVIGQILNQCIKSIRKFGGVRQPVVSLLLDYSNGGGGGGGPATIMASPFLADEDCVIFMTCF